MSSFLAIPNCHEHGLLSHLISCDLKIDNQALAIAIQQLPDSQLDLLKSMEDRCVATVDVNRLCGKALKEKKMLFLAHYIEAGARWPKHHTEILHALLNDKCLDNFERALKLLEPDKVKDIDIVDFISAKWLSRFDHISVLIDAGANPDGKRNSLAAVRGVKINIGKKVDIICSLIRRGANCNKLCDTNTTTPLHVATELVIESGRFVQCTFVCAGKILKDKFFSLILKFENLYHSGWLSLQSFPTIFVIAYFHIQTITGQGTGLSRIG